MDSQPIVFIVRHGARLDAADKDWHLTSPTPYDPPLCYSGWLQCRSLGMRIASLLQAPDFIGKSQGEQTEPVTSEDKTSPTPASSDLHNRYNVIIHTSPFLRCLQTSIAISAGLSQSGETTKSSDTGDKNQAFHRDAADIDPRPLVRVDAFLGEWLSPDYFDQITPPPSSDRMVALAKAELLRRGEIIPQAWEGTKGARTTSGHFPGGWSSHSSPTTPGEDDGHSSPQHGLSSTPRQTVQRQRASTVDIPQTPILLGGAPTALARLDTNLEAVRNRSYVPPIPNYAVSGSDPIPSGYVTHARDACTRIDYQWDSMRTPMWGTGGDYGEEWSFMQDRVAEGFKRMMNWYRSNPSDPSLSPVAMGALPSEDRPKQTVLILVTHGADCNALINSVAGHSILLDIGTSSLTLAVPRKRLPSTDSKSDQTSKASSQNTGQISQEYALHLVASTDHLRSGSASKPSTPTYRNRVSSRPQPLQGTFSMEPVSVNGMGPRGWTLARRPSTSDMPRAPSGLWGSLASPIEKDEETEEDLVPNFGDQRPTSQDSKLPEGPVDRTEWATKLPHRTRSQRGLWGSAVSLDDRDSPSRRRWTVTEQKL
ncbi:uncharacterized protein N7483_005182 [Penicillium malachiteum]|uniref:uncharacterized protein n=1 Tax=Penicillium malachiteum TaxID=1324776 RepID=UPI0025478FE8|nr:uncharacterized protein N7483_005182 [Penicillium malachiteum]KAJ5730674.1 hypothetical protein N7483_005182 [Penicillium malachiteum]